ncbi:FecR family protein [Myroides fluvii]|uniref:FecR family protein n=1 Tax=Myroides fluvii TaxID=2572594 RepID=UPI00131B3F71|nr:FecR family protein [Myroides fluvii]
MIKKFRQLCGKYLNQTASSSEKKVVDDFIQTLQEQPFVNRDQVKDDKQLKQRMYSRIKFTTGIKKRQQKRKQQALFVLTLVTLLISGIGLSVDFFFSNHKQYSVALGEKTQSIQLDDTTTVTLTPGSKLMVSNDFNTVNRQVQLEGEAFFNVARNEAKPFIVQTNQVAVAVLGTSFLVNDHEVVVKTGKVVVENQQETQTDKVWLTAHEKVTFSNGEFKKSLVDVLSLYSSYKAALVMHEIPLLTWKKIIEEEFNVLVQIEDLPQTELYTTGDFRSTSLQDIVHSFCFIHQVKYTVSGSHIRLEK